MAQTMPAIFFGHEADVTAVQLSMDETQLAGKATK